MAKKSKDLQYYESVGRRREAQARVRLYIVSKGKDVTIKGVKIAKGQIMINGKLIEEVILHDYDKQRLLKPLQFLGAIHRIFKADFASFVKNSLVSAYVSISPILPATLWIS